MSSTIVILPEDSIALPCYHHAQEFVEIRGNLRKALSDSARTEARREQGTYMFCRGCHINCYLDPSFTFHLNSLFFRSLSAKGSYAYHKYFRYRRKPPFSLLPGRGRVIASP